jgi:hypothetical protein
VKQARFQRITDSIHSSLSLVDEIARLNVALVSQGASENLLTNQEICVENY